MSFSLQEEIAELERQRTALLQKLNAAQEFWAQVESTLKAHRVHALRDLPKELQRSLVERLTQLPHAGKIHLDLLRLERQRTELTAGLAQHSCEAR